jgi:DNA polymerase-3 subunit delta
VTHPIYVLSGEPFLTDEALERVRSEEKTDDLSEILLDADSSVPEFLEAVGTASLFGDRRLVIVRDAQDLRKDLLEAATAYLESPNPDTILALIATGKTKLDAAAKKLGAIVSLDAPKGRRLVGWLRERAKDHKLKLDDRGGWGLIDSVGTELRDLDSALEQLSTAKGDGTTISATDVRRMFPRLADERTFAFTDAVGERRLSDAMTALRRLLDQGDEPLAVFGVLVAHLRRLLRVRRLADHGSRAVGEALGMPEWRAEKMAKQARSFREEELIQAMGVMADADIEMKGEFPSSQVALERAVVRVVTGTAAG